MGEGNSEDREPFDFTEELSLNRDTFPLIRKSSLPSMEEILDAIGTYYREKLSGVFGSSGLNSSCNSDKIRDLIRKDLRYSPTSLASLSKQVYINPMAIKRLFRSLKRELLASLDEYFPDTGSSSQDQLQSSQSQNVLCEDDESH